MPPSRITGISSAGSAVQVIHGHSRSGIGASTGIVVAVRLDGVDRHLGERHQQARNDAAEEQVADRGVRDQRIEHHRDRRRDDRPDHRRRRRDRRRIAHRIAVVARHHVDADAPGAGEVGDRRARHAGEDDALRDVDVAEAAAEAPDQHVAEAQQVVGHLADVHQLGGEQEQRHREQHVAVVQAVEDLLGRGAEVEACEQQIEDRAGDHRIADRQAEQAEAHDGAEAEPNAFIAPSRCRSRCPARGRGSRARSAPRSAR